MIGALALAVAAALPVAIPAPESREDGWVAVGRQQPAAEPADGYLVELPGAGEEITEADLSWLLELAAGGVPVVGVAAAPPSELLPYLDGFLPWPSPPGDALGDLVRSLAGAALVVRVADVAGAVTALAAGAVAVVLFDPPPDLGTALTGLLPDRYAARWQEEVLPTAMRESDLATVVGLPAGFPGGLVVLSGVWHGDGEILSAAGRETVLPSRVGGDTGFVVPEELLDGGLLVVDRPGTAMREVVGVAGERIWRVEEILARHHRAVVRQMRALPRWQARQRLVVRVWIAELGRSLEVTLAGPVFAESGGAADWEITEAWLEGVRWKPEDLPELPLLEPRRPPVPPLAVRLQTGFTYRLVGRDPFEGRSAFLLQFQGSGSEGEARRGRAWIDEETFGLLGLEEIGERLPGEVQSSRSLTRLALRVEGDDTFWLPVSVAADDLVAAFGRTVTVRREVTLWDHVLAPDFFERDLQSAHAGPRPMLRETAAGIVPLVPDGMGGRIPGPAPRPRQRFLLAGAVFDPGFAFPVPLGGLQIQDFNYRGRGEQLRLLLAGVVNDGAWASRPGNLELTARGFVQLLPLASTYYLAGREQPEQELELRRQRLGAGIATSRGPFRLALDLGVDRWDFSTSDNTGTAFTLPRDTWEGTLRFQIDTVVNGTTFALGAETGHRFQWHPWGLDAAEDRGRTWRRARLLVLRETTPFPLVRTRVEGELWIGSDLDRFSAPAPARFGDLRLRGIATGRVVPDALAVVRGGIAVPLSPRLRGEAAVDLGWVRDRRAGYHARPLAGVELGFTAPGPWGSLLQGTVGYPITTPGPRGLTAQVILLRGL